MITIQNLTVTYPDQTTAIDNLSLSVDKNENIALLGGNGAGKTSLLLALVNVLEAQSGTIKIDDIVLCKKTVSEIRKRVGLVFQNPDDQLFMPYIFDDIAFGCRNFGMTENEVKIRVAETLDQLGISQLQKRSSLKLSGGEKRMAAIATVLAMRPSILMFDEPTAFLDHKARRALIATLKDLPHTKIVATHDLTFALEVCNRVVLLKNGSVVKEGGLDLLYDKKVMESCGMDAIIKT